MKPSRRGGLRSPAGGRPRSDGSTDPLVRTGLAVTTKQRDKLRALGGSAWVRARIDEAPEPG